VEENAVIRDAVKSLSACLALLVFLTLPVAAQQTQNAPAGVPSGDAPSVSSPTPDLPTMEPMIHRYGLDTQLDGLLATVLKLTADNKHWRCRLFHLKMEGEPDAWRWIAQGWGDSPDLIYGRTENDRDIVIRVMADGTFVTAVSIDDKTGNGVRLHFADVKELLDHDVATWNDAAKWY
jgi:hypothetical protein